MFQRIDYLTSTNFLLHALAFLTISSDSLYLPGMSSSGNLLLVIVRLEALGDHVPAMVFEDFARVGTIVLALGTCQPSYASTHYGLCEGLSEGTYWF